MKSIVEFLVKGNIHKLKDPFNPQLYSDFKWDYYEFNKLSNMDKIKQKLSIFLKENGYKENSVDDYIRLYTKLYNLSKALKCCDFDTDKNFENDIKNIKNRLSIDVNLDNFLYHLSAIKLLLLTKVINFTE